MKTLQGFFCSAPLWRFCVAWSRWNHGFLTSSRPWRQMVRHGLTADEARAGRGTAATSLVPMLHGWLFTMAFIVGWDLAFEAVWTLWHSRWVFYLNAVPIALAIPVLVIVLCRVAGRRTAPERLLGRVQAAVSALRPPVIPLRRRRPGQPGRWFALSRLRARQRRRLKALAWQIDGDLALLAGYPPRHRDPARSLGKVLVWAADDLDDDKRVRLAVCSCNDVVRHVVSGQPWPVPMDGWDPRKESLVKWRFVDFATGLKRLVPAIVLPVVTAVLVTLATGVLK